MLYRNKRGSVMLGWRIKCSSAPFPPANQLCSSLGALPLLDFWRVLWRWELFLSTTTWRWAIFPFFPGEYQGCFLDMCLGKELDREAEKMGNPGDCSPEFWIQQFQEQMMQALHTLSSSFGKCSMSHQEPGADGPRQVCRTLSSRMGHLAAIHLPLYWICPVPKPWVYWSSLVSCSEQFA